MQHGFFNGLSGFREDILRLLNTLMMLPFTSYVHTKANLLTTIGF